MTEQQCYLYPDATPFLRQEPMIRINFARKPMKVRRACALVLLLTAAAALLGSSGCSETLPAPAPKPAPATDVGRREAWRDAERIAVAGEGRTTVVGSGDSMRPIYGENTVLVISKIEFDELKTGMQVAYVNSAGRRVVHVLTARDARGWRIQGLNNAEEDAERVTRYNLIGVIYASFATDEELN